MSRELRFVFKLFASFAGFVALSCAIAVIVVAYTLKLMPHASPAERTRIAARIADVPHNYRIVQANDVLYGLTVAMISNDKRMRVLLQSNTIPGANISEAATDGFTETLYAKRMQRSAGSACAKPDVRSESLTLKGQTITVDTFTCPEARKPLRMAFARFEGRSGPATMIAWGTASAWDGNGLREILASAR
jgi:hypothetical protein